MAVQIVGSLLAVYITGSLLWLIYRVPSPEPYDWPVWVYRAALAIQARLPWSRS